jgi:hypothetical protein
MADDSSVSSVSSFEYESSSSDEEELRFSIQIPSLTMIYGKSMSGKSTFVQDLIIGEYFDPPPTQFYLLIPKPATDMVAEEKIKNFVDTVQAAYSPYDNENGLIFVAQDVNGSGITEVIEKIQSQPSDAVKLLFIDDLLSEKMLRALNKIANEVMHHSNVGVLITSQGFFIKDAKILRENSNYIVIFPGLPDLPRFFSGYSQDIKTAIVALLGQQRDDEYDVPGLEYPKPIIIDKEPDRNFNMLRIWRDVHDISPTELPIGKSSEQTESLVRQLIVRK